MNRRDALSAVSLLIGGTIIGAEAFLGGCSDSKQTGAGSLSVDDLGFLDEVGETILPATASSPGAKASEIGKFMDVIVADCYTPDQQKIFREGISKLKEACKSATGNDFLDLGSDARTSFLKILDEEARSYGSTRKDGDPETHYFSMIKQLTVWGYFSSEVGATQALSLVEVPGHYEACVPIKPGQKAWA